MHANFDNLPAEKKMKILQVCVDEFAEHSYKEASTNEIVKKAGISKGILFHYFGSKKNLYLYILEYAINHFAKALLSELDNLSSDIFDRLIEWSINKIKISYENFKIYKIIMSAFLDTPIDVKVDIEEMSTRLFSQLMPKFLEGIDVSRFKKGIDAQKVMQIIMISLDGLSNKYINELIKIGAENSLNKMEEIVEEIKEYMEILKYGVYERK